MCYSPWGHKKSGNDLATTTAKHGRYLKIHFDIILFFPVLKRKDGYYVHFIDKETLSQEEGKNFPRFRPLTSWDLSPGGPFGSHL